MKRFTKQFTDELTQRAQDSARRRAHHNVHEDYAQPVQRLFVSMLPDSYVRPHRHTSPTKWEFFLVVAGTLDILLFDEQGVLTERIALTAGGDTFGLEIPPNTWHCTVCDAPVTFVEVKQGPYEVMDDKDFASWAPPEGEPEVPSALHALKRLQTGQRLTF